MGTNYYLMPKPRVRHALGAGGCIANKVGYDVITGDFS